MHDRIFLCLDSYVLCAVYVCSSKKRVLFDLFTCYYLSDLLLEKCYKLHGDRINAVMNYML